jgi:integrase
MKDEEQKDLPNLIDDSLKLTARTAKDICSTSDINYLKAATADNTRLAYRSDIRHFERSGGLLPTTPDAILKYLHDYAVSLNPRTLARRITAIKQWHLYQGFADPTQHATIGKTLKGLARIHGKPRVKAYALTVPDLLNIISALKEDFSLTAIRDNAILQIGYFGALRRSEITNMCMEDLTWCDEGLDILIPQSKADQTHEGQFSAVPYGKGELCPLQALKCWLDNANIKTGFIFRSIKKGNKVQASKLTGASINQIVKSRAEQAGLSSFNEISSHSLRRGLTTSGSEANASLTSLMRHGRWKHTNTVMEYIDATARFKDNVATRVMKAFHIKK